MSSVGARPRFDFEGSLELAREAWTFAETLNTQALTRADSRNTALNAWLGTHGDDYRNRAEDENDGTDNVTLMLLEYASAWGVQWGLAASETIRVIYSEAVEAQRRANEEKSRWYDSLKFWEWGGKEEYGQVQQPPNFDGVGPALGPEFAAQPVFPVYGKRGDDYSIIDWQASPPPVVT